METDYAFEMASSNLRFGSGATREVGMDLDELGVKRVMVLTDPHLSHLPPVQTVLDSLANQNIDYSLYDRVRVEPTDTSLRDAVAFAQADYFDGFVAVGGGSTIDTAKAANLYSALPAGRFS